jgi:hypothetical protein
MTIFDQIMIQDAINEQKLALALAAMAAYRKSKQPELSGKSKQ